MYEDRFKLQAKILKALAQSRRLEIVQLLRDQELSVSKIHAMLDLPQANVSQHLMVLRDAKILKSRKNGKQIFYSLADPRIIQALDSVRSYLIDQIETKELQEQVSQPIHQLLPLVHDPVCQMRLSPQLANFVHTHQGKTYYFCASGCHKKFMQNPQTYVQE